MNTSGDDINGISDYLFEKISADIGADRIIPVSPGQIAYIDTEDCAVYLVTVQRARFVVDDALGKDTA